MRRACLRFWLIAWPWAVSFSLIATAAGQTLTVRSELQRPTAQGGIAAADHAAAPRELLSPALPRNAWTSFQVTIAADAHTNYFLFTGANPPGVVRVEIYRERFVRQGREWVADELEPARPEEFGVIPDPNAAIPGQSARAYLVDVWVPADAPVGRMRLEIQLKSGGWTIWPMEVRILPAVVPGTVAAVTAPLPALAAPAAECAGAPLAAFLKGIAAPAAPPVSSAPRTIRDVIRRNVAQDMALAATLDRAQVVPAIERFLAHAGEDGESYLRVRDLIYRLASHGQMQ